MRGSDQTIKSRVAGAMGIIVCGLTLGAWAATPEERIDELERKIDVLTQEVERSRFGHDIYIAPGQSVHGLGVAASKVYAKGSGVSIGGYGEALYQNFKGDAVDQADFVRAVFYIGHKFTDQWLLNTEIEFEHASTGESGSASVEFAYLDYLWSPAVNLRAGLVLVPMGLVNELHEPTAYLTARRPETENRIIPSTWRENGVGVFGDVGTVRYGAYLVNGMEGRAFSASGLRSGRQKGSKAQAEDFAGVARVDWCPLEGIRVGGAVYAGDSGQDLGLGLSTEIYEAHVDIRRHGLQLRALATAARVDDVAELNRLLADVAEDGSIPADGDIDSIGETMKGWYVEAGLDVLHYLGTHEATLMPYVRYETLDTQHGVPAGFGRSGTYDREIVTMGLNYKPIAEVVFKVDYEVHEQEVGAGVDQFNLAMGYVF